MRCGHQTILLIALHPAQNDTSCVSFRYLLHVFMEAGCLEWCVVIGLILRDASVIKQVIGFLDSPEVPQETVQSVRSGLLAVDAWASTDWWVIQCG